jgi:tetratricopeptide (TPR) repeat protein
MTRDEKIAWIWVWSAIPLVAIAVVVTLSFYRNVPIAYFNAYLCGQSNMPDAIAACDRLVADEGVPAQLRSLALRRLIQLRSSEPEAIGLLTQLIELGTADAEDWNMRGLSFYWRRDYDKAAHDFEQAATLNGAVGMYWANLADAQTETRNFAAAVRNYSNAITHDYDGGGIRGKRGWAQHRLGNDADALADYDMAIERNPESADNFNERALVHHAIGDYYRALADFDRSHGLAPDNPVILVNRAVTYVRLGKWESAKQDLDRATAFGQDQTGDAAAADPSSASKKRAYGSFEGKIGDVSRRTTRCQEYDKMPVDTPLGQLTWPACAY